jgi:aspartate/methionine/tyrosine aminotransferase
VKIETFELERIQSLYENRVEINLSDSGVHPYTLRELLTDAEIERILTTPIGYGWTNGAPELRETIAALYENRTPDNVIVTNGSAEAIFVLGMTLLEPGDELIIVVPNYLQLWGWARAMGVKVVGVPLHEALGWEPDLDELAAAITPRTKMISVCHPNNPTGSVLRRETMDQIVNLARAHDCYLHADEVYQGVEFSGVTPPSFGDLYEKAVVTNGLSKAMALPGLRIGWIVGPAAEIEATWARKDYTSITTSAISQVVATIALQPERRAAILDRSRQLLRENLGILERWVAHHGDLLSVVRPDAGGMAFVRYNLPINSTDLVHRIREEQSVLLVPGDVFGMDGYFRIGIGSEPTNLQAGLGRISRVIERMPVS